MALNAPLLGGGPSTRGLNAGLSASYRASRASLFESVELPERDVVAKAQELKQKFDRRAVKRARRFRWGRRAEADESESRDLKGELQMVRGLRLRGTALGVAQLTIFRASLDRAPAQPGAALPEYVDECDFCE